VFCLCVVRVVAVASYVFNLMSSLGYVADACCTPFPADEFDVVCDKSLIDTLMCVEVRLRN
jgi:hypothetical protein